jgi:hypothetical protein
VDIPQEAIVALDELRAVLEPVIPQPLDLAIGISVSSPGSTFTF